MNKYKDIKSAKEQLRILDWRKDCKCSWRVNFYGQIMRGDNGACRAHDTRWQKFITVLKRTFKPYFSR